MTEQTATRKPLTSTTWATLAANHAYLSRKYSQALATRLFWDDTYDLACELSDMHAHLTDESARVLVDLCVSGTPVIVTWEQGIGEGMVEMTTAACVVEYVGTAAIYVHYCGFGHWIQLSAVTDARTFETTRTYRQTGQTYR